MESVPEKMWMPLRNFCDKYPWPTITTLRWMIWQAEKMLGHSPMFILRYGKRILIDVNLFHAWLESEEASIIKDKWRENKKKTPVSVEQLDLVNDLK